VQLRGTNDLQRRLDEAAFTVHLPNERVNGEVRGQRHVTIRLAPGHYEQVGSAKLCTELANLARLLFARGLREREIAVKEVTGRTLRPRIRIGRRGTAYAQALRELAAEGESDDGTVRVTAVGQQNFVVEIAPGTLDRLSQQEFEANCGQAADRLLADTEAKAARARVEIFEPLPGVRI
jgi:hypothetical protein